MSAKRAFDLFVTITASVAWVPVLLLTALAIAIREGLPVFYVSRRMVAPGKLRPVLKFRTMIRDAEKRYNREVVPISADGVRFLNLPPESPLYTPIGRVIERLAFTEIPQLLNVLRGDMSLVGNRPLPASVVESLREVFPQVEARFRTPAGLAGPVQLIGRERVSDAQRLDLEITYCNVASRINPWAMDFKILLFTVLAALRLRYPMSVEEVAQFLLGHLEGAPVQPAMPSAHRHVEGVRAALAARAPRIGRDSEEPVLRLAKESKARAEEPADIDA